MKTLKTFIAAVALLVSSSAFAADETTSSEKLNIQFTLKTYVDAVTYGKIKGLAEVLDNDVKFTTTRGEKILNFSKSDMLETLKNTENVQQNCTTSYSVIEQDATQAVIKVTMKYAGFSKVNLVSMANTTKGWKITNVSSSFN